MSSDKYYLTYNQQMKKLRNDKKIVCEGSPHKKLLVRAGYFNLVNGYKAPFISGKTPSNEHIYISGTSISELQFVKSFDDMLRSFILRYITQVEEEVRALTSYKFDQCNGNGTISWYDTDAYSPNSTLQNRMSTISRAYQQISRSKLDYVEFYMNNHTQIPTWIMLKVVDFSTFIDVLSYSKTDVTHGICNLYNMLDANGLPNVKLLIGSLHWMRTIRNSCAHNERVYCLSRTKSPGGRILETYINSLGGGYVRDRSQKIFDLLVYMKYYLPKPEYTVFITNLKEMLIDLQSKIHPQAFDYVRAQIGIKKLEDLDSLIRLPKDDIEYNKFDK